MRTYAWFYGPALLLSLLANATQAQRRASDPTSPYVATSTPLVRVTTQNPREINIGKPATFVFSVANQGKAPATGVVVATTVPGHVDVSKSDPKPISVEGRVHKFDVGDLAPGATRRLTMVVVPRTTEPIRLDSTLIFATSTRASVIVRRPMLKLTAQAPPRVVIGEKTNWLVRVTNTGDGPADSVVLTPSLVEGEIQGRLQAAVQIGTLKAGATKEISLSITPTRRGKLTAKFQGSNPDGLKASAESTFQVLQAQLAVKVDGPHMQPMARVGVYEVRVSNPGDAPTDSTLISVKIPQGLEITSAAENAYHEPTRTLRWRVKTIRPGGSVQVKFQAETIGEGEQKLGVTARSDKIAEAATTHTTNVISRPNPIVTIYNDQEASAIGEPIGFRIVVLNAGSKLAERLRVRVAMPDHMEPVSSREYQVTGGQIEFPAQKLASGEKVTLRFRAVGRQVGEHRLRVLLDGIALTSELAFEGSAYCYREHAETPSETTGEDG